MTTLTTRSVRPAELCDHCKLECDVSETIRVGDRKFCCAGCRAVAETLHELGLDEFYALRDESIPRSAVSVDTDSRIYDRYDDPAVAEAIERIDDDGVRHVDLLIEGAHCAGCVWVLEQLPRLLPTVASARLELPRGILRISMRSGERSLSELFSMIARLGYTAHPLRGVDELRWRRAEERRHILRLGVAFACFANAMLFAFALYGDHFQGMSEEWRRNFRLLGFVCSVIALVLPGRVFLFGALASIRTRRPHMDLPVAIALVVGTLWGGANSLRGVGEVYFESLTAVIFLLTIGRYLQFRQQRAAADSIELLYSMTPRLANRVENGVVRVVPVDSLARDEVVEVAPGETVPADGVIESGRSDFDDALMSGESIPKTLGVGNDVVAGSINISDTVRVRVARTGTDTRLGKLLARMRNEITSRTAVVRLADRAAHRLVCGVIGLAILTFVWWSRVSLGVAAEHAIALLIVTCPCALGLATPLAIEVALGHAARRGILVKNGDVIERLSRGGLVVFDKTGTVTSGVATLVDFDGDRETIDEAAALERGLAHPYARALVRVAANDAKVVSQRRFVAGGGVVGVVDGKSVAIGNASFLESLGKTRDHTRVSASSRFVEAGLAPVEIAVDERVVATCGFGDPPRANASALVRRLTKLGFDCSLLSGDDPRIAARVAEAIGIGAEACEGGASPERKIAAITEAKQRHELVVMVGDGVNDAAALAKSDVGIALKGGAEASLEAADVYLARGDIADIEHLVVGCRRTMAVVRGNLIASLSYNLVAATLAVCGVLHPWMAAVLMPLSSLTVVALSFRRRTFDPMPRAEGAACSSSN